MPDYLFELRDRVIRKWNGAKNEGAGVIDQRRHAGNVNLYHVLFPKASFWAPEEDLQAAEKESEAAV